MFYQYSMNYNENLNINLEDLLKKTIKLLKANKKLVSMVEAGRKSQKIENLIEKYSHKAYINFTSNCLIMLPSI